MQIQVLCMPITDRMSTPMVTNGRSKDSDPKGRKILHTARRRTLLFSTMTVKCLIFYMDPKSVGSHNFLGEDRVRFPITDERSSLAVFAKKFAEFAGLKAEVEKSGLAFYVELKFCRLEKGKYGSKAFAINPQEQ